MNYEDSYHEMEVRRLVFNTELHFSLLQKSYVASSLIRRTYSPSDLAWQSELDCIEEYRDLIRRADSILEKMGARLEKKILDDKLASETPF